MPDRGLLGEKITYDFSDDPIDIVILAIDKDLLTLDTCIDGIKNYGDHTMSNGDSAKFILGLLHLAATRNCEDELAQVVL